MSSIKGILFDLDGTLLDTAPDLVFTINCLRQEHHLPPLSLAAIRPIVSLGSKAMVKLALGIEENHPEFSRIRQHFLDLYLEHLANETNFFPHVEKVLGYLELQQIPWGIVTNKLTQHTRILLKALALDQRAACIICGDSLPTYKPDPAPILHGCELLKRDPQTCLYVGDCATDVIASKAAGTKSLVALYGYIGKEEDPYAWQADGYVEEPLEIIDWLKEYL